MTIELLEHEVLKLSKSDRLNLLKVLADSLMVSDDDRLDAETEAMLDWRMAEVKAGTAKMIPAQEVEQKLREKYGL